MDTILGRLILVAACVAGSAISQTQLDLRTQSKNIDFTSAVATKPFKSGTVLPAICSLAETFFNINAQPGQNLYVCTALNTWTLASGSGITNFNGLSSSSQTFTNDTNVTIVSGGTAHVITWSGSLAKARQHAATVYTDQANTYAGAFVQDFSAISHVRLPVAAGYTPTVTGHLGYDSTAKVYKGFNGSAVKTLAFLDSSITGNAATATAFASAPAKCAAGNYPLGIDAFGNAQNCTAAGTGGVGSGITSLNGLSSSSQTFTNDTNVTIVSGGTGHVITWSGSLAKARQHAASVYTDQANTYAGAFVQDFSAISHVRLPVAAGYSPTVTGHLGYDSTANVYKGFNGSAVKTLAFLDSSITGNAATATAFASAPAKCSAGNYPLGIDASGNAQNCTVAGGGGGGGGNPSGQTTVPSSATPTYAVTKNSFEAQTMTLTANVTSSSLTVASGTPLIELALCQDGTGGRTNVWPANVNGAPAITPDPNSCTNIAGTWNGSALNVSFYSVTNSSAPPALVYQINGTTYTQTLSAQNGTVATLADVAAGGGGGGASGVVTIVAENWIPLGACNSGAQSSLQVNTPADNSMISCSNDGIIATAPGTGSHPITFGFRLPSTWTAATNINLTFSWFEGSTGDTTKVAAWNGAIKCMNESGGSLGAGGVMTFPASLADYNTPSSSSASLPGNQVLTKVSLNALVSTGCTPGSLVFARVERDNTVANNDPSVVRIVQGLNVTYTRTNR